MREYCNIGALFVPLCPASQPRFTSLLHVKWTRIPAARTSRLLLAYPPFLFFNNMHLLPQIGVVIPQGFHLSLQLLLKVIVSISPSQVNTVWNVGHVEYSELCAAVSLKIYDDGYTLCPSSTLASVVKTSVSATKLQPTMPSSGRALLQFSPAQANFVPTEYFDTSNSWIAVETMATESSTIAEATDVAWAMTESAAAVAWAARLVAAPSRPGIG
ncbi:uncharacterized protein B0I36DRAFT_350542 [Microdochium trichocladiopsis]|uniref:Uncharacterized protein n=1 Tax=Microdochium trichocladiopsis TaxID=1682393 RepID=A0A9P8Y614_9PEZI|nr:uncharacterized protein B0I36DRAFT_350542 [Microdochium trichocladiopsis]KAH7029715.1 hypothetical protein B0I36DRAFT_350542 [Microdochium trichocladiopsis]